MTISFGIAILILLELWRAYRDPWNEPAHGKIINMVKSSLIGEDFFSLSPDRRAEALHLRFIYRDRQMMGPSDFYRVRNIVGYAVFLTSVRRFDEAIKWNLYAERLIIHNKGVGSHEHLDLIFALGRFYQLSLSYKHSALENLKQAHAGFHKLNSPVAKLAEVTEVLFEALIDAKDFSAAFATADSLVKLLETQHGITSPQVREAVAKISMCASGANFTTVADLYDRHSNLLLSVTGGEAMLGKDHHLLAPELNKLAEFYRQRLDPALARALEERASMLCLWRKVQGPEYFNILRDIEEVAIWLEKRHESLDKHIAFHLRLKAKKLRDKRLSAKPARK